MAKLCTLLIVMATLCDYSGAILHYHNITRPRALCNDFSRPGFFRTPDEEQRSSNKWVIFLESGGFCYSAESCNRRFIHPNLRPSVNMSSETFDPARTWQESADLRLHQRVSPLMRAVQHYRDALPQGHLEVEGKDILDGDCEENPV